MKLFILTTRNAMYFCRWMSVFRQNLQNIHIAKKADTGRGMLEDDNLNNARVIQRFVSQVGP
jgi:hypothetical protein